MVAEQKIGCIAGVTPLSPDTAFTSLDRDLIDVQARFLEESGVAFYLGVAAEVIPGASFYYTDAAGISSQIYPGYVLTGREYKQPAKLLNRISGTETVSVSITLSPDIRRNSFDVSIAKSSLNFQPDDSEAKVWNPQSVTYMYPSFSPKAEDKRGVIGHLFTLIDNFKLVPEEDKPEVLKALAARGGRI